jgi:hypothetical protein
MLFQVRWRSAEGQAMLKHELKRLQKGITTLLEASHYHLLVTPPSHFTPQKVKGFVVG